MDFAYLDFMKQFGSDDLLTTALETDPVKAKRPAVTAVPGIKSEEIKTESLDYLDPKDTIRTGVTKKPFKGELPDLGAGLMDAGVGAMELFNRKDANTEAGGGGPESQGSYALRKGMAGAQMGKAIGKMVPIPGADKVLGTVGFAAGAVKGMVNQREDVKDWLDNEQTANLEEMAVEKKKRAESFRMEEGLNSMEGLKALRKKQLGIVT